MFRLTKQNGTWGYQGLGLKSYHYDPRLRHKVYKCQSDGDSYLCKKIENMPITAGDQETYTFEPIESDVNLRYLMESYLGLYAITNWNRGKIFKIRCQLKCNIYEKLRDTVKKTQRKLEKYLEQNSRFAHIYAFQLQKLRDDIEKIPESMTIKDLIDLENTSSIESFSENNQISDLTNKVFLQLYEERDRFGDQPNQCQFTDAIIDNNFIRFLNFFPDDCHNQWKIGTQVDNFVNGKSYTYYRHIDCLKFCKSGSFVLEGIDEFLIFFGFGNRHNPEDDRLLILGIGIIFIMEHLQTIIQSKKKLCFFGHSSGAVNILYLAYLFSLDSNGLSQLKQSFEQEHCRQVDLRLKQIADEGNQNKLKYHFLEQFSLENIHRYFMEKDKDYNYYKSYRSYLKPILKDKLGSYFRIDDQRKRDNWWIETSEITQLEDQSITREAYQYPSIWTFASDALDLWKKFREENHLDGYLRDNLAFLGSAGHPVFDYRISFADLNSFYRHKIIHLAVYGKMYNLDQYFPDSFVHSMVALKDTGYVNSDLIFLKGFPIGNSKALKINDLLIYAGDKELVMDPIPNPFYYDLFHHFKSTYRILIKQLLLPENKHMFRQVELYFRGLPVFDR